MAEGGKFCKHLPLRAHRYSLIRTEDVQVSLLGCQLHISEGASVWRHPSSHGRMSANSALTNVFSAELSARPTGATLHECTAALDEIEFMTSSSRVRLVFAAVEEASRMFRHTPVQSSEPAAPVPSAQAWLPGEPANKDTVLVRVSTTRTMWLPSSQINTLSDTELADTPRMLFILAATPTPLA